MLRLLALPVLLAAILAAGCGGSGESRRFRPRSEESALSFSTTPSSRICPSPTTSPTRYACAAWQGQAARPGAPCPRARPAGGSRGAAARSSPANSSSGSPSPVLSSFDPGVLLMDEPLGALDRGLRIELQDEL